MRNKAKRQSLRKSLMEFVKGCRGCTDSNVIECGLISWGEVLQLFAQFHMLTMAQRFFLQAFSVLEFKVVSVFINATTNYELT